MAKVIIKIIERGRIPILNWKVAVETDGAIWEGEFPTRERLESFLCGVRAGAASQGEFNVQEERTLGD